MKRNQETNGLLVSNGDCRNLCGMVTANVLPIETNWLETNWLSRGFFMYFTGSAWFPN